MPSERSLDLVLFGASSFVGILTANYLAAAQPGLRWAIAGRNREKLEAVRRGLPGGASPELLLADVADAASIRMLAERGRVVLTTVGPYTRYGEGLVAACAELGSDYVDLTGEPGFFARSLARYHETAARSGARILHACGFDSIPHDLGALFTLNALRERLPPSERDKTPITIEAVVRMKGGISGGTWQSALLIMSETSFGNAPAANAPNGRSVSKLPARIHYRKDQGVWAMPAPTIDPEIVLQSARIRSDYGPEFRYGHYIGMKNLPQVAGFLLGVGTVFTLSKIPPARALLGKLNPPGKGPSQAQRDQSHFRVTFTGQAGAQRVRCQVSGGDPGYGETAKMMAETGLCLVNDRARLPARTGVLTTASALGEVLIERLQRAGIRFQQLPE